MLEIRARINPASMRNNTGKVAVLMGTIGAFLAVLGLAVAVPTTDASPHSPWYCYRLAPQFITSSVTPCTFPCLYISSNVHPHIVVQPELDGTPCHMAPSLHHKTQVSPALHHATEVGTCRRGVCTLKRRPPVLKRKKRFICLITLAALYKAKKDRQKLREQMASLRRLAFYNSRGGVHRVTGSGVGNGLYPHRRTDGTVSAGGNSALGDGIEIHIVPGVANVGVVAGNSGREISPSFIPDSRGGGTIGNANIRHRLPGGTDGVTNGRTRLSGGYSNLGNGEIGVPGLESTNAGLSITGTRIGIPGTGIVGRGASAPELGEGGNFAFGNGRVDGSLGGNSGLAAGIAGARITGNGGRNSIGETNARTSIAGVAAAASRRSGRGGSSTTVVGVVGTRASTPGGGIGINGESDTFVNEGGNLMNRELVGAGSVFATGSSPNSNVNVGSGAVGATISGSSLGVGGIGSVNSALAGAVGSFRGRNVGGSTRRGGATGFSTRNGMGADTEGNSSFGSDVDDNENFNGDFDDTEVPERRTTDNTRFRG